MNIVAIPESGAQKGDLVPLSYKDWLYEKEVSRYVINMINKTQNEFKNGKAIRWQPIFKKVNTYEKQ